MDTGVQLGRRFRVAQAVDDPAIVRRAGDPRAAVPSTSGSRSCLPRGWTRTPISSGWRRCRSASSASGGIPPVERSRPRSSTPPTNGCSIAVNQTGDVFLSHTRLREGVALRLAIGHLDTTERHVKNAWGLLVEKTTEL